MSNVLYTSGGKKPQLSSRIHTWVWSSLKNLVFQMPSSVAFYAQRQEPCLANFFFWLSHRKGKSVAQQKICAHTQLLDSKHCLDLHAPSCSSSKVRILHNWIRVTSWRNLPHYTMLKYCSSSSCTDTSCRFDHSVQIWLYLHSVYYTLLMCVAPPFVKW